MNNWNYLVFFISTKNLTTHTKFKMKYQGSNVQAQSGEKNLKSAPRINGIVSSWKVRREPNLSTKEETPKLPINAPAMNMLTTSPSRKEFPSKPSSCAIASIGPFITLQGYLHFKFCKWQKKPSRTS